MAETGYQAATLPGWGSMADISNEANPDLVWPRSIEVYDRMRNEDAQVGSVLRAVILPLMKARFELDPAGARPEIVAHIAGDMGLPVKGEPRTAPRRMRGRFSWKEHLRHALLQLPYGFSCFEQVYEISPLGLVHLRKLGWRPPRTISEIKVARDGGLEAVHQWGHAGSSTIVLPVDRLVMYVHEREGGNWLGRPLLRQAYKHWMLKDRALRVQAIALERNGIGIPHYKTTPPPKDATPEEQLAWNVAELERGLEVAQSVRAGEMAGVAGSGELSLIGVQGTLPDIGAAIRYQDEQIARAVLAHFLNLGTETGSWALGSTFANFFTDSLNAVAEDIVAIFQQHVIDDIVDLNWGVDEPAPQLVCQPIGAEHAVTAEAIKALIECGALEPDDALDDHLRSLYALPSRQRDDATVDALAVHFGADPAAVAETTAQARQARRISRRDQQQALEAAQVAQKAYLATDKPVLNQTEVRRLIERAGGELIGDPPDGPPPTPPTTVEESS